MQEEVTAVVLRNRGAPVPLRMIGEDGQPVLDPAGGEITELRWLRFDANAIAELEEWFGGHYETQPVIEQGPDGQPQQARDPLTGEPATQQIVREVAEELDRALTESAVKTTRRIMALVFGVTEREMGHRMMPAHADDYSAAVGAAFSIAMGIDPDAVKKGWDAALRLNALRQRVRAAALSENAHEKTMAASPGQTSSTSGALPHPEEPADPSMSSGD